MRHLVLLAALLPATAIAAPARTDPTCVKPSGWAIADTGRAGPRKLGDLPPAKQVREIAGCPQPVVLRRVQPAR